MIWRSNLGNGKLFRYLLLVVFAAAASACVEPESGSYHDAATYKNPIYSEIARKSFTYEGPLRNPVIVIHGLLGARLTDRADGENVWGSFSYRSISEGEHFAKLAHPMGLDRPLNELRNSVEPSGVMDYSAVRVMGLNFYINNYDMLLDLLENCGYQPEVTPLPSNRHFASMFIFYYDWRRDISENACRLAAFIQQKKTYLEQRYEAIYHHRNYPVKFDLIGHSMGGLLARYYAMYGGKLLPGEKHGPRPVTWAGAKNIGKLIMIGTPNAGYVDTLLELNHGLRLVSAAPAYPKALIGTFVSYYQMLPDPTCRAVQYEDGSPVDYFDLRTWERYNWGLLDPEQDIWLQRLLPKVTDPAARRKIARDHLDKCLVRARQFRKAMLPDKLPPPPRGLQFYLIAGDAVLTNQVVQVDRKTGAVKVVKTETGDGKILTSSAVFDRRTGNSWQWQMDSPIPWRAVYIFQGGHMGIMNSPVFASNLSYILAGIPSE